ncbi:MAG: tRNA (adenosine(37)-N6)-threonylcarbamoyltransferase complex ATPase subunit type 1 TsaE [Sinobacteraceae bacterium]|nr:tRNA (adenosine(37)-N6)-threonylcarbamoyltransferase complex ATPase subunit type 1 TsaE [Nevskiaceae bacterium]
MEGYFVACATGWMMGEGDVLQRLLKDEAATIACGCALAAALPASGAFAIALGGPLGAGKSTLARALLRGLGVDGPIPSPTYTLIEPYSTRRGAVYHMDFYRLESVQEADLLGLDDIIQEQALCLVEWPERGAENLIDFDLKVALQHADPGRQIKLQAQTEAGQKVLKQMKDDT